MNDKASPNLKIFYKNHENVDSHIKLMTSQYGLSIFLGKPLFTPKKKKNTYYDYQVYVFVL